jgi:hypothetical protein
MSEELMQTLATSSITMQVEMASAPAWNPARVRASRASTGNRLRSSTSAACAAICCSAIARTAWRTMSCSSLS